MSSRPRRRVVLLMVAALASMTMIGSSGASAHPCTTLYVQGQTQVCTSGPATVWNPVGLGFCGTGCVEVHSQPSVHTYGETSVTVLDNRIVTVNVPEEDVYLGTFCYTTPGGSC